MSDYEIVNLTPENLNRYDLFCKKSKPKELCYQNKLAWYLERFKEGLRIKLLTVDEGKPNKVSRGFIEYVPAENGWRVVNAPGYALIHCIWVVGKHKKKGYGSELLTLAVDEAESQGRKGVVAVTTAGNWASGPKLFEKHGFEQIDEAPPSFKLMVKKIADAPDPSFPSDWDKRAQAFGKGLTIVHTVQCPYILDATDIIINAADELAITSRVIDLKNPKEVMERAPCAYGVFNIVYGGNLIGYSWLSKKDAPGVLAEAKRTYG